MCRLRHFFLYREAEELVVTRIRLPHLRGAAVVAEARRVAVVGVHPEVVAAELRLPSECRNQGRPHCC